MCPIIFPMNASSFAGSTFTVPSTSLLSEQVEWLAVMLPEPGLLVPSRSGVIHQRRNLHELDAWPYAVETRYALQKRIGEKRFGCVFRVPDIEVRCLALSGVDRE